MDARSQAEKASRRYIYFVSRAEIVDGGSGYLAEIHELPGCLGQGGTFDEAVADLETAAIDYIESLLNDGRPIPEPTPIDKIVWPLT